MPGSSNSLPSPSRLDHRQVEAQQANNIIEACVRVISRRPEVDGQILVPCRLGSTAGVEVQANRLARIRRRVRIPMKWGTDSDASGAASGRSDAGYSYDLRSAPLGSRFLWLVRAIAIGIISFPSSSSRLCFGIRVPIEVGRDFDQRWGTVSTGNGAQFRTKWGAVSTKVGQPIRCPTGGQSIFGSDGSAGPTSVFGTEFAVCNQRFSISSILRRTWSQ